MKKILFILVIFSGCIFFSGCNQNDLENNDNKHVDYNESTRVVSNGVIDFNLNKVELQANGSAKRYNFDEELYDDIITLINNIEEIKEIDKLTSCTGWSYILHLYDQDNKLYRLSSNCDRLSITYDNKEYIADNKYLKEFYNIVEKGIKKQFVVEFDTSKVNDFSIGIIINQKLIEIQADSLNEIINDIDYILDNYKEYRFTPTEIYKDILDYKYVLSNENEELIIYLYTDNDTNTDIALIHKDKNTDKTISIWIKNQFLNEVNKLVRFIEDNI